MGPAVVTTTKLLAVLFATLALLGLIEAQTNTLTLTGTCQNYIHFLPFRNISSKYSRLRGDKPCLADFSCNGDQTSSPKQPRFVKKINKVDFATRSYKPFDRCRTRTDYIGLHDLSWDCGPPVDTTDIDEDKDSSHYLAQFTFTNKRANISYPYIPLNGLAPAKSQVIQGFLLTGNRWFRSKEVKCDDDAWGGGQDQTGARFLVPIYNYIPNDNNYKSIAGTNGTVLIQKNNYNALGENIIKNIKKYFSNGTDIVREGKIKSQLYLYYSICPTKHAVQKLAFVYDEKDCRSNEKDSDCAGITAVAFNCSEIRCNAQYYFSSDDTVRSNENNENIRYCKKLISCQKCMRFDATQRDIVESTSLPGFAASQQARCGDKSQDGDCQSCGTGYQLQLVFPSRNEPRFLCTLYCAPVDLTQKQCYGGLPRPTQDYVFPGVRANQEDELLLKKKDLQTCEEFFLSRNVDSSPKPLTFDDAFSDTTLETGTPDKLWFNNYKYHVWLAASSLNSETEIGCRTGGGAAQLRLSQCSPTGCYAGFEYNPPCCNLIDACGTVASGGSQTGAEFCAPRGCFPLDTELDGPRRAPFFSCNCTCDSSSFCGQDPESATVDEVCLCNDKYVYDSTSKTNGLQGSTSKVCFTCLNSLGFEDSTCSGHGVCTPSALPAVRPECVCEQGYIGKGCEFLSTTSFSCGNMWDVSCSPDVLLEDRFRADTSWLFSNTWECTLDPVGGATIGEEYGLQVLRQSVAFKNVALTREPFGNNFAFINKQELCWSFAYKIAQGFTEEAVGLAAQQSGVYRSVNQDALLTRFPSSPLGYQLFGVPWTERTSLSRAEYPASSGLLSGARGLCPFPFNEDLSTDINDLAVAPQPLSAVLENEDLRFIPCRRPSPEQVFAVEFQLLPESAFGAAVLGANASSWKVNCFPLRESLRHNSAVLLRCLRLENYPHIDCVVHVPFQFIQVSSEAEITWSEAEQGLSCETYCRQRSRICSLSAFAAAATNLANIYQLGLYVPNQDNLLCSSVVEVATQTNVTAGEFASLALPFREISTNQCFVPAAASATTWKYSCAGKKNGSARLCPCTNFVKQNIVLQPNTLESLITNQCAILQTLN